jgi:protein-S-isoprenylcysteine O-methyltransferase
MSTGALVFGLNSYLLTFVIVVSIWLSSEIVGGRIIPNLRRGDSKVEQRKKGLNIIGVIGWEAVIVASILFAGFDITVLPGWAFLLGIAIILAGVALRQWAVAVLGRYFTHVIGIQEGQKVVQAGPYRLIRHPSYAGILLIQLGIALALQSWGAVVVVGLSFSLAYGHRILYEERFLAQELGDSYLEYMKHTKRIIPLLL